MSPTSTLPQHRGPGAAPVLSTRLLRRASDAYQAINATLDERNPDRQRGPYSQVDRGDTMDAVLERAGITFASDPTRYLYAVEDVLAEVRRRETSTAGRSRG